MSVHLGLRGPGHLARTRAVFGPPTYGAEAEALFARFAVDPGEARRGQIDSLIGALKAAGAWAKLDALYLFAAHDAQAARLNWIQPAFDATAVNGPTFTADRGYAGDGASAYLDTGFNDLTGSALWSQDAMCAGIWVNQWAGSSNSVLGLTGGTASLRIGASATTIVSRIHSTTSFNPAFSNASPGHLVATRDGATSSRMLRNGASVTTSTAASTANANATVVIGRATSAYNADRVAAAHLGGFLTPAEVAALYSALSAYLGALGAA
jgi:hypothetical protein